jgi:hypothetical protein
MALQSWRLYGTGVVELEPSQFDIFAIQVSWWASNASTGVHIMPTTTTKDGVEIFYKDWGPRNAQPLVFHHGWPLSADDCPRSW